MLDDGQYNVSWQALHMLPEEVIQAAIDLNAKALLPIHNSKYALALHSWYGPLERVKQEGRKRNVNVAKPEIGETFIVGGKLPNNTWWSQHYTKNY